MGELVKFDDTDALTLTLKGTELLKALGVDFALGDVNLSVASDKITASVLGANLALTKGEAFTADTEGYTDILPYAEALIGFLKDTQYLHADVEYTAENLSVAGTLELSLADLAVQGNVEVTYNGAAISVGFIYAEEVIYLNVNGLKVKANVNEAISLITGLLGINTDNLTSSELDILETVFALDLGELVKFDDTDALTLTLKGTELLKALGVDFDLGDVNLSVASDKITASVLGADLALTKGEAFTADTEGYTDILPLVNAVIDLVRENGLKVSVGYTKGDLSLAGTLSVSLKEFAVKGELTVSYQTAGKTVGFAYGADGYIYLTIEGAKLKLSVKDAVGAVTQIVGAEAGEPDLNEILSKLFALNLGEVIDLTSESSLLLRGTQLLRALGVQFDLGDLSLERNENGSISVAAEENSALNGLALTLTKGAAFAIDGDDYADYADVTPVLDTVIEIIKNESLSIGGTLALTYQNTRITLSVQNGAIAWGGDGFMLTLDLILTLDDVSQKIEVYADAERVKLVYGSVGVDLEYTESALRGLSDAFRSVYERIMTTAQGYVVGETLPADFDALTSSMQTGSVVAELLAKLDLPSMINAISFGAPKQGGIVSVSYGDISAELKSGKDGSLTIAVLPFSTGDLTLSGTLTAGTFAGTIEEPEGEYLTNDDIAELLDFVGAAFGTLTARDVRWMIDENAKTVYTSEGATKFNIEGELVYHAGGDTLFTIDTENKTFIVDPESYVYVKLWLDEVAAEGTDLYFEFWMLDYDGNEELDFFVSLSKYRPEDTENYAPLNFAVSASDILTLASSGVSLLQDTLQSFLAQLGITETDAVFGIINDYLISKWLTPDEQGQFGAVGSVLMNTLGINEAIKGMLDGVTEAVTGETVLADIPFDYYLTELGVTYDEAAGTTSFTVALDSDLVYGGEGLSPLTVTLTKAGEQGSSLLTGMALENIYGENNSERTSVSFAVSYEPLTLANADGSAVLSSGAGESAVKVASLTYSEYANYMFDGVDELLKSIALSATHKDGDSYKLNDSFYISGEATISISGLEWLFKEATVTVNGLSVALDEDGSVALDMTISYSSDGLLGSVAFASSGTTRISIREELIYIERDTGAIERRAMTLDSFLSNIMDEIAFILNFTSFVKGFLPDSVGGGGGSNIGDYGDILSNILVKYAYNSSYERTDGTTGKSWELTLNGPAMTGNALENIVVTLASDANDLLQDLSLTTSVGGILKIDATLGFDNPQGEWEDGKSDQTTDISDNFKNLVPVTIIAPESLGGKWEQNEDGTWSRTILMFEKKTITFVYGDQSTTFTVQAGENVINLADVEGLPDNMFWSEGTLEYTTEGSRIEISLTPDYIVYNSTIAFALGDAENVMQTTVGFDKAYTLETPTAEGYTFLGWYVLDENGNPVRMTDVSYSEVGGKTLTVEAMWAKDLVISATGKEDYKVFWSNYTTSAGIVSGGELVGAFTSKFNVEVKTTYYFFLQGNSWTRDNTQTFDGIQTSASWKNDGDMVLAKYFENTVTLTYQYTYEKNGEQIVELMGSVSTVARVDL